MKETTAQALLTALKANTTALRALTKRLNEQGLSTDAVSVTPLPERWSTEAEDYKDGWSVK